MNKKTVASDDREFLFIREGHEEEIFRLYCEAGWYSPEENVSPKFIRDVIQGSFAYLIVLDNSRLIGMGRIISDGKSDAYIQDVVVTRKYRGQGIGKAIVLKLIEHLKKSGIDWIGLISQPGTSHFYEKIGFEILQDYHPMKLKKI